MKIDIEQAQHLLASTPCQGPGTARAVNTQISLQKNAPLTTAIDSLLTCIAQY